jgi:hypothetical protein
MLPVISASRRMDLPAFQAKAFMRHVQQGEIWVPNPWSGQRERISLASEDIAGFLFWTRRPGPLLPWLNELLDRYGRRLRFSVSYIGMPKELEPRSPGLEETLKSLVQLCDTLGRDAISWRFDPILISRDTPLEWWCQQFERLLPLFANFCSEVISSWLDLYRKTERNLRDTTGLEKAAEDDQVELLQWMGRQAEAYHLPLKLCCEPELQKANGLPRASCIDAEWFEAANGWLPGSLCSTPNRTGCGCCKNRDIGIYDQCAFGCRYCYANRIPLSKVNPDPWSAE